MNKNNYDVAIIGGGISGLVCGCYLAKSGLRTLIVEKNDKVGGYCVSFKKKGLHFDACAHSLGSLRKEGYITNIFKELEISKGIKIQRYDPQDIVICPDFKIHFWNDLNKTIAEFQEKFPKEAKSTEKFFKGIISLKNIGFASLRTKTFKDFLDTYFKDVRLKAILSLPILGNACMAPSLISAYTAVNLYKEFIFDGGYYPQGGMQEFANILLKRFKEYQGKIMLSTLAKGIGIKNNCVEGIRIDNEEFIASRYVVSNVDARQTFINLMKKNMAGEETLDKLNSLRPSLSIFILYLGTDGSIDDIPAGSNVWFLPHYDIEKMYSISAKEKVDKSDWFMVRLSPNKKTITMLVSSTFETSKYWKANKKKLIEIFIKKIEHVIPNLSRHIILKDAATPHTLYKRTSNYEGAAYGWEGTPAQFALPEFSQATSIKNLYLTGHWTSLAQGIPGVAYLGRDTAKIVLNKERRKK